MTSSAPGYRQIRRIIRQQAKAVLVANGIQPSTKRGNRELKVALHRLAMQPFDDLSTVAQVGQELGQKIVDQSKATNKSNLDAGIIRQMVLSGEIPTVARTAQKPAKTAPVVVAPPQTKATSAEAISVPEEAAAPAEAPSANDTADLTPAPATPPSVEGDEAPPGVADEVQTTLQAAELVETETADGDGNSTILETSGGVADVDATDDEEFELVPKSVASAAGDEAAQEEPVTAAAGDEAAEEEPAALVEGDDEIQAEAESLEADDVAEAESLEADDVDEAEEVPAASVNAEADDNEEDDLEVDDGVEILAEVATEPAPAEEETSKESPALAVDEDEAEVSAALLEEDEAEAEEPVVLIQNEEDPIEEPSDSEETPDAEALITGKA